MQKSLAGCAAVSAIALVAGSAAAQRYERALGGPNAFEQAFDVDTYNFAGDYVTAGDFASGPQNFLQVARFNKVGNRLWNRVYQSTFTTTGFSIETANNGDILVAGLSDTTASGGLSTIVMRLRPDGTVIWSNRYAGTVGSDTIHTPQPGPALIEDAFDQIYVVTNFQGAPAAFRLQANGAVVWSWIYYDPTANVGGPREGEFAFTDIKYEIDGTLAISGTVRLFDPTLDLPFLSLQDPMILRIDRNGIPIAAAHYNLSAPHPVDAKETGDGLDVNDMTGELVVAGRTDRPMGAPSMAQHWVIAQPPLVGIMGSNFSDTDVSLDSTTGYSSVRYSLNMQEFAVVGAFAPSAGQATIHGFHIGGAPLWRWNSATDAQFDGLVPAPSCGYIAVGRIGDFISGGLDDLFHAKTNNAGDTSCNLPRPFFFEPNPPRTFFFPVEIGSAPLVEPFPVTPFVPFDLQPVICSSPWCNPCLPDWNNDGVLDFFDVQQFLADFSAMNPRADINNDGAFDFFDVQAFLQAFSNGCP